MEEYKEKYEMALSNMRKFRDALKNHEETNLWVLKDDIVTDIEYYFPELVESEDERIRKDIISALKYANHKGVYDKHIAYLEKMKDFDKQLEEAYKNSDEVQYKRGYDDGYLEGIVNAKKELEKQGEMDIEMDIEKPITIGKRMAVSGKLKELIDNKDPKSIEETKEKMLAEAEQNPVDKVEPKFKVGNWYQCTKDFFGKGVTFDKDTAYYCAKEGCLQNQYGCHIAIVKELYDNFKLWTIQDAKDGDVLQLGKVTAIFKKYIGDGNCKCYCSVYDGEFEIPNTDNSYGCHNAVPATKEQRYTLEKAMTDAGYTFDFGKKEMKLLISNGGDFEPELSQEPTKWTEEDERLFNSVYNTLEGIAPLSYKKEIEWLTSIKERLQ